ncbi:hypothetical protein EDB89DRAFT_1957608, partial [Lactarius sanguifluus]
NRHSMMRGWKLRSAGASESVHPSVVGVCLCNVATRLVRGTVAPPWTIWIKTLQEPFKDPLILFAHSTMSYYPNQYGTQQTSAQNVPQQQQRQSASQPRYQTSTSAQVSSRSEYPEQITVYPSYNNGAPQAQQAYLDPYGAGYGNPAFPLAEPHSSPTSGSHLQRSPSGQSATQYPSASSSVQRSPSGQSAGHYSSASSSVQRTHSGQPTTLYAPSSSSVQHSHSGQSATHYPPASSAAQHSYTGQSTAYYPPTQAFDSTNTSYPGPQQTSHYAVPHGHGTNASDGSRSSNHYQTAAPLTRVTPDPLYRGTQPQVTQGGVAQPQYRDADEYDNVDEHRPKSPGRGPVQGRQYNCRLPECNRPMFFDRRFNEFWEWCSPQHIHAGLGRRIEKTCRHCGVWPRKYGHKYCGGPSCNKSGVPIPSY